MGSDTRKSVALLGLSGDPAHPGGHLGVSRVLNQMGNDEVWWSITPQNPFKVNRARLSYEHRIALAEILLNDENATGIVKLLDLEAKMPVTDEGYRTATLLAELNRLYGDKYRFTFTMGSDNWKMFHTWGNFEDILRQGSVLVFNRGDTLEDLLGCPAGMRFADQRDTLKDGAVAPGHWRLVESFDHPVSSTLIARELTETGHSDHLTPGQLAYIKQHGLFKKP